ncbi:MAG TPA: hypothetical protein DD381_11440, partial [Lentisphaeria bacterium]|nr:hypothetical protein [Lentisphaeria bacterium]
MITLGLYEILEIVFGLVFFWVGIYLLSKNPFSKLSWAIFGVLLCWSIIIGTDPIHTNSRNLEEFLIWQKVLNLPLFYGAVIFFHTSVIVRSNQKIFNKILLYFGYLAITFFYILSLNTDLLFRKEIFANDFRYSSVLPAGKYFWLLLIFVYGYLSLTVYNYLKAVKEGANKKYIFPALACLSCVLLATTKGISYYFAVPYINFVFNIEVAIVALAIVYAMVRYHLFAAEERIFDRTFLYKTIGIMIILLIYLSSFVFLNNQFAFSSLVYLVALLAIVLTTHSFYEWLITFINDLLYNPSSGFSVVNDEEVANALKNYNSPNRLDESPLLRLKIVNSGSNSNVPVDQLRKCIKESIEYFAPEEDKDRRTKRNLKYHLLKMLAFDEAEEGQIL